MTGEIDLLSRKGPGERGLGMSVGGTGGMCPSAVDCSDLLLLICR